MNLWLVMTATIAALVLARLLEQKYLSDMEGKAALHQWSVRLSLRLAVAAFVIAVILGIQLLR